jgi:hypothetical protein
LDGIRPAGRAAAGRVVKTMRGQANLEGRKINDSGA